MFHNENPGRRCPLTGAYFWVPRPLSDGLVWDLLTCHDLGVWDGVSHREFWPHVVEHLAVAWGKDAVPLKRRLLDHYTGLPRGRITHPKPGYLVIHGGDSPTADWLSQIVHRFLLIDGEFELAYTDHESMAPGDLAAVQEALGVSLGLGRPV